MSGKNFLFITAVAAIYLFLGIVLIKQRDRFTKAESTSSCQKSFHLSYGDCLRYMGIGTIVLGVLMFVAGTLKYLNII